MADPVPPEPEPEPERFGAALKSTNQMYRQALWGADPLLKVPEAPPQKEAA
jgi:hypothetical protein